MKSGAHKQIIRILIVVIVLLMSMQVVNGALDTELEIGQSDVADTCSIERDDHGVVIDDTGTGVRIAVAFVPRHGPLFGMEAEIGGGTSIGFKIGWIRPCGGLIEVEYLPVAIRKNPDGQD